MAERRDRSAASAIARPRPSPPQDGGSARAWSWRPRSPQSRWAPPAAAAGTAPATTPADSPAPAASDFPSANGKTLTQILSASDAQRSNLVVSPTAAVYEQGREPLRLRRLHGLSRAGGRRPGRDLRGAQRRRARPSARSRPGSRASRSSPSSSRRRPPRTPTRRRSSTSPTSKLDRDGNWDLVAHVPRGQRLHAPASSPRSRSAAPTTSPRSASARRAIHTPTVSDVGGDVGQIDTRSPHDDMHKVDFADVLGKEPVVLLFATPALCQSRVCGPVVDVAEQVEHEAGDGVDFIHMEVFNNNNASDGLPPADAGVRPADRALGVRDRPPGHRSHPHPGRLRRLGAGAGRPPGRWLAGAWTATPGLIQTGWCRAPCRWPLCHGSPSVVRRLRHRLSLEYPGAQRGEILFVERPGVVHLNRLAKQPRAPASLHPRVPGGFTPGAPPTSANEHVPPNPFRQETGIRSTKKLRPSTASLRPWYRRPPRRRGGATSRSRSSVASVPCPSHNRDQGR